MGVEIWRGGFEIRGVACKRSVNACFCVPHDTQREFFVDIFR